jgi:hypothetical protein
MPGGEANGVMEFTGQRQAGVYQVRLYLDWAGTRSYDVAHRHTFYVGVQPPATEQPAPVTPEDGAEPALPEDGGGLVWTSRDVYAPRGGRGSER